MEGNECYRFSTIRDYLGRSGGPPVRLIADIGAYAGDMSMLARSYFPEAKVYALEPDEKWFRIAVEKTSHDPAIRIWKRAFSAQQLYRDDFGDSPYTSPVRLQLWRPPFPAGASVVLAEGESPKSATPYTDGYWPASATLRAITLSKLLRVLRRVEGTEEIDIMKIDCEGCEHSGLGTAAEPDLLKIRHIVGEYHYFDRFYRMLERKLFRTHKVHMEGDRSLGCFFAERRDGTGDGILQHEKARSRGVRPELADFPIEWHEFDPQYRSV